MINPRGLSAVMLAGLLAACNNSPAPAPTPTPTPQALVLDSFAAAPNPAPQNVGTVFNWTVLGGSGAVSCQLDVDNDGDFDYSLESCTSASKQSHQYENPGSYTAKLVVSDAGGAKQEKTAGVTVLANNRKPQVLSFSAERGSSELGVRFSFRVFDPEGDILSCKVDLDSDGVYEYEFVPCSNTSGAAQAGQVGVQSYSGSFEAKYGAKGQYSARLEVMDAYNQVLEVLPLDLPFGKPVQPGPCEVANLNNTGEGSLRALVQSGRCNVITFMEGLSGVIPVSPEIELVRSVQIVGPGAGVITLDGRGRNPILYELREGDYSFSGLTLRNGYNDSSGGAIQTNDNSSNFTLDGVVIRDSRTNNNGGALSMIANGLLVVRNSHFINNYADGHRGGAIEALFSNVLFENNRFEGNYSNQDGGAVFLGALFGPAILRGNTFTNNEAFSSGGAVHFGFSVEDITLEGNTFSNNQGDAGGAVYIQDDVEDVTIERNTFSNNQAGTFGGLGGALYIEGDQEKAFFTVSKNAFDANEAEFGGAVYLEGSNPSFSMALSNNRFTNNQARSIGGAFYTQDNIGTLTFSGDVFEDNSAANDGGAMYFAFAAVDGVTLTNVRLENNSANTAGAIALENGTLILDLASRILGNSAITRGGGLYVNLGTLELPADVPNGSPIITGNTCNDAAPCGGGVYNNAGTVNGDTADGVSGNIGNDNIAP